MKVTDSLEKATRFARSYHGGVMVECSDGDYFSVEEINEIVSNLERKIIKLEQTIEEIEVNDPNNPVTWKRYDDM